MYPHLEFDQQYRVAQKVLEFVAQVVRSESRSDVFRTAPS
jgi:hypothetical protein